MDRTLGQERILDELREGGHGPLSQLLIDLRASLNAPAMEAGEVRQTATSILEYLVVAENRTHENCVAVDWFLGLDREWKGDWDLPESLSAVVQDMAMLLHDTVESPEIAARLNATPEQLLARIKAIQV